MTAMLDKAADTSASTTDPAECVAEVERLTYILDAVPFLVSFIDTNQRYLYVNRAYESPAWFGVPLDNLRGCTVRDAVGEAEYGAIQPYIERVLAGEFIDYEIAAADPDSAVRFRHAVYSPSRSATTGEVIGYVCVVRDITARKEAEEQIRWLAYHDSLTRLPNRALFHDRLEQAIARAKRTSESVALLYIDLDGFKPINDTYGHDQGDDLLRQVATRLEQSVRAEDTVSRIGGDEFVVLLPFLTTPEEAPQVAQRIHDSLSTPFQLFQSPEQEALPRVSACIGISIFPEHGTDGPSLLRSADEAMYRAKRGGPGTYRLHQLVSRS
jgi:diguanylate cyclase (GGDEF)-like protein/PAS domain S-box-containing protein